MAGQSHTAGPWVAQIEYEHGPIVVTPGGAIIADYTCWTRDDLAEARANARLIAAAPELFDFAVALDADWTKEFPDGPDTDFSDAGFHLAADTVVLWRQCRAAIAKATGGADANP